MSQPEGERYKIVEREISESVASRFPELAGEKVFRVFDNLNQRYVPFGNYGSRDRAQRRIDRLKALDRGVEEL
jgi:hypothetical protein